MDTQTENALILFVDDNPQVLSGLRRMLRPYKAQWRMEFLDNGVDALKMMKEDRVDVLVTDLQMPLMSGMTLLKYAHKVSPKTVCLILSGHASEKDEISAVQMAHAFLRKPCNEKELLGAVTAAYLQSIQQTLTNPADWSV